MTVNQFKHVLLPLILKFTAISSRIADLFRETHNTYIFPKGDHNFITKLLVWNQTIKCCTFTGFMLLMKTLMVIVITMAEYSIIAYNMSTGTCFASCQF